MSGRLKKDIKIIFDLEENTLLWWYGVCVLYFWVFFAVTASESYELLHLVRMIVQLLLPFGVYITAEHYVNAKSMLYLSMGDTRKRFIKRCALVRIIAGVQTFAIMLLLDLILFSLLRQIPFEAYVLNGLTYVAYISIAASLGTIAGSIPVEWGKLRGAILVLVILVYGGFAAMMMWIYNVQLDNGSASGLYDMWMTLILSKRVLILLGTAIVVSGLAASSYILMKRRILKQEVRL